jgi:hypothetical protein
MDYKEVSRLLFGSAYLQADLYCRKIPQSQQGRNAKTICMLEDEGTLMAVEEYMTGEGKLATALGLANAITEHWQREGIKKKDGSKKELAERTAREWMHRRGYKWTDLKKGVYKSLKEWGDNLTEALRHK